MMEKNKKFREINGTDFSKMSVQGYDVLMYFCSSFFLEDNHPDLLMNEFQMEQISPEDGFENKHAYLVEQEGFELVEVE